MIFLFSVPECSICQDELIYIHEIKRFTMECPHICHVACYDTWRQHTPATQKVSCVLCRKPGLEHGTQTEFQDSYLLPEAVQTTPLREEDMEYEVGWSEFFEPEILPSYVEGGSGENSPGSHHPSPRQHRVTDLDDINFPPEIYGRTPVLIGNQIVYLD